MLPVVLTGHGVGVSRLLSEAAIVIIAALPLALSALLRTVIRVRLESVARCGCRSALRSPVIGTCYHCSLATRRCVWLAITALDRVTPFATPTKFRTVESHMVSLMPCCKTWRRFVGCTSPMACDGRLPVWRSPRVPRAYPRLARRRAQSARHHPVPCGATGICVAPGDGRPSCADDTFR